MIHTHEWSGTRCPIFSALVILGKMQKMEHVPYESNCNKSPNTISFLFVFQLLCFEFPLFFFWAEFFLKYILFLKKNRLFGARYLKEILHGPPWIMVHDSWNKILQTSRPLTLIFAFSCFKFLLSSLTLLWCFWSMWRAWLSVIRFCVRFWGAIISDLSSLNTGRTSRRWVTCSGE